MRVAHAVSILSEMAAALRPYAARRGAMGAATRINLALGRRLDAAAYVAAQRRRTRAIAICRRALEACDVIVTPATAITAPPIPRGGDRHGWSDLRTVTALMRYVVPGNLVGLPAIAAPVGVDERGLPIGLQAMARPWDERTLLRVARALHAIAPPPRAPRAIDLLAR
jgi:Asp-tRNA(Asn)/Glu-tRNA(Gln) amidotransferase A subunit family amidase